MTQNITPCLWFDGQAEQAMNFYTSVFKDSKVGTVSRYGAGQNRPEGSVLTATFQLNGQDFMALNGGPEFKFNQAISFVVDCKDQDEVDYYWEKLSEGGVQDQCGWLKDRFGVSWQIVPRALGEMMSAGDEQKSGRMMQALLQMKKLDIAALRRAYEQG